MEPTAAMAEEKAFLGHEFLTWLWFAGERDEGLFRLADGEVIEVWPDDLLTLESLMTDSQENTLKGRSPSTSEEARTALRTGKKVVKARFRIRKGERDWTFLIKGRSLDPASVKLPAVLAKADEERLLERLYLLEELDGMIEGLYRKFLEIRLSPAWEKEELPAIRSWVASKLTD